MDQVFAERQVCEKYLANGKGVFWAFMDLEKAYDGWCEGGVGQQRNDGGGCATMLERPESVESPGTYVTK